MKQRMRGLPVALAALLMMVATDPVSAGPGPGSERVRLSVNDGETIEARVFDPGTGILDVLLRHGRRQVPKSEVDRFAFLGDPAGTATNLLILQNGHEVHGQVEFSTQEGAWVVQLEAGQARYPDAEVICMVQPSGFTSHGAFTPRGGFHTRVDRAIEQVRSGTVSEREDGTVFLSRAGFFAVPQLREAVASKDPDGRLRKLLVKARTLIALPASIENEFPEFQKTVLTGSPVARVQLLQDAFLARGDDLFPLLGVLLEDDQQSAELRSFCVELLQRLGQIQVLVETYQQTTGRAQLAIAVALGDAGIYIGLPTLMEALSLPSPEVQKLAADKLEEYTGERFGFQPDAETSIQQTAIARWQSWWRAHREAIEEVLTARIAPELGDASNFRSQGLVARANQAWAQQEFDIAYDYFRSALEEDPTNLQPLLGLGVLSYLHRGDLREAEQWFLRALKRPPLEGEEELLRLVYYHLGRLHLNRLEFEQARRAFGRAISLDSDFIAAWFDLARAMYQETIYSPDLTPDERRDRFGEAARTFESGLSELRRYREGLVVMTRTNLPTGSEMPFSPREHNRDLKEFKRYLRSLEGQFALELARTQLALGALPRALEWATLAVELPEPSPAAHLMLAGILEALGRGSEATFEKERAARLQERLDREAAEAAEAVKGSEKKQ